MKRNVIGMWLVMLILFLSACGRVPTEMPDSTITSGSEQTETVSNGQGAEQSEGVPGETVVSIDYANAELLAAYDSFEEFVDDNSEYQVKVIFTTNTSVKDFKFLELSYVDTDEKGDMRFNIDKELHTIKELSSQFPFVVDMAFEGIVPTRGISYVAEDGAVKCYAIQMSGEDDSLMLTEIEI